MDLPFLILLGERRASAAWAFIQVNWTLWFGRSIEPKFRLRQVHVVVPDHAVAVLVGTDTPEESFVL